MTIHIFGIKKVVMLCNARYFANIAYLIIVQIHREHEMHFQPATTSSSVADVARPSAGHVAVDAEWTGDGKFSQSVSQISCRSRHLRNRRNARWSWRFAEPLKKFRNFNSSERFTAEFATSYIAQNAEISETILDSAFLYDNHLS